MSFEEAAIALTFLVGILWLLVSMAETKNEQRSMRNGIIAGNYFLLVILLLLKYK